MIGLLVGQLLPWVLGSSLVAALLRNSAANNGTALVIGYGYAVGTVILTLWMRALSLVDVGWNWITVGGPLLAAVAIASWYLNRVGARIAVFALPSRDLVAKGLSARATMIIWWLVVGLIAVHLSLAALEIVWRPLFPWDAWTQWATKARVWYEMRQMVPFSNVESWFAGNGYVDAAPGYPANVPLLQAWACLTLGRWDDSLMNVPLLLFVPALALAFYGQLRSAGLGEVWSAAGAYAVLSLPFLDTHAALAGYADLPLAVYFGLSAIALWRWAVSRDRPQLVLAVLLAIACPFTKHPGWAWICVLLPAVVVMLMPRRGFLLVVATIATAFVALAVLGRTEYTVGGYRLGTFSPVWEPLWQNYFEFANWHLLWYLLPTLMILNAARLLKPRIAPGTAMIVSGLSLLFVVFSFSNASAWVADYSTVNRATLHLAPLMIFYMMVLARATLSGGDGDGGSESQTRSDTAVSTVV